MSITVGDTTYSWGGGHWMSVESPSGATIVLVHKETQIGFVDLVLFMDALN